MMGSIYKAEATGAAAIAVSIAVPENRPYRLISVAVTFSGAPTTSETLRITLDAGAGAVHDVELYSVDPAAVDMTDLVWFPDNELILEPGDAVVVAFTNTNTVTYGVQVTMEEVV